MSKFASNAILSLLLIAATGGAYDNTPAEYEDSIAKLKQEKAQLLQRIDRVSASSERYKTELNIPTQA